MERELQNEGRQQDKMQGRGKQRGKFNVDFIVKADVFLYNRGTVEASCIVKRQRVHKFISGQKIFTPTV